MEPYYHVGLPVVDDESVYAEPQYYYQDQGGPQYVMEQNPRNVRFDGDPQNNRIEPASIRRPPSVYGLDESGWVETTAPMGQYPDYGMMQRQNMQDPRLQYDQLSEAQFDYPIPPQQLRRLSDVNFYDQWNQGQQYAGPQMQRQQPSLRQQIQPQPVLIRDQVQPQPFLIRDQVQAPMAPPSVSSIEPANTYSQKPMVGQAYQEQIDQKTNVQNEQTSMPPMQKEDLEAFMNVDEIPEHLQYDAKFGDPNKGRSFLDRLKGEYVWTGDGQRKIRRGLRFQRPAGNECCHHLVTLVGITISITVLAMIQALSGNNSDYFRHSELPLPLITNSTETTDVPETVPLTIVETIESPIPYIQGTLEFEKLIFICASYGGTAAMVFGQPLSNMSQPWSVFVGNLVGAFAGVFSSQMFGNWIAPKPPKKKRRRNATRRKYTATSWPSNCTTRRRNN